MPASRSGTPSSAVEGSWSRTFLALVALVGALAACGPSPSAPAAPRLLVTPDSLAFHGRVGATVLPDQYLALSLAGNAAGRWTASEDGSWFFVPTTTGTLPFFLPVAPRPAGLAAGGYSASIWVTGAEDTVRIPVTLELEPTLSLSGRWVGQADPARVALDLAESGGQVTGWGTAGPPTRRVAVAGTWADPSVTLTLTAGADTLRFRGSLVDDNALAGTLTGGGVPDVALTLYRQ